MDYNQSRKEIHEATLAAQKEAANQQYKYESRRTALQIAERTSKNQEGQKGDTKDVLDDAKVIYEWLINELVQ